MPSHHRKFLTPIERPADSDLSDAEAEELMLLCGHAPGPEPLSPAAQAVWDAAWQLSPVNCESHKDRRRQQIAAALRAAATYCPRDRLILMSIADELEGQQ